MKVFRLVMIIFCMLCSGVLSAQQVIKTIIQSDTKKSIVHYWMDSISIAYVPEEGSGGYFVYEANNANALFAHVNVSCEVNDFKIMDDTVFFCGVIPFGANPYGFVGCFDIKDLFFNGGQANVCMIPNTDNINNCGRMSIPRRMDVYRSKGFVHIAMAGEMSDADHPNDPDGATLEDAYFDGTNWHFCNLVNKNNIEYYTDITCTGNYVVAVARDRLTNVCYLRAFEATGVFLNKPIYPDHLMQIVDSTVRGDILIEAIDTNALALCHYYSDAGASGIAVSTVKLNVMGQAYYSYITSRIVQNNSPVCSPLWALREMRYNKTMKRLYILQDMDYPIHSAITSTVLDMVVNINNLELSTSRAIWSDMYGKLHDIDIYKQDGFVSTGNAEDGNLLFFKERYDADTLCHKEKRISVIKEPCHSMVIYTDDENNTKSYNPVLQFVIVEERPVFVDCND